MRSKLAFSALAAIALPLTACAPVDPGMGEALAYDKVAQTVNPDPQYPANAMQPGADGNHAAKATERYRKGQTKAVQPMRTSSGSSGSGGGSGQGPQ